MTEAERAAAIQAVNHMIRNGEVHAGVVRLLRLLSEARREVLADLVETEWDRHALPTQLAAIDRQLDHVRQLALQHLRADMGTLWDLGAVHASEAAAAVRIEVAFQEIPTSLLQALESKMAQRVTGLFNFAKDQLDRIISVGLLSGESREDTIQRIGRVLELGSTDRPEGFFWSVSARARFIYQQEVGTAYAVAAARRQQQAASYVPELKKVWSHDGHPRIPRQGHLLMDGQIREINEDFVDPITGDALSFPRDPAADISAVANCTCASYLWRKEYGALPSQAERNRDARVAAARLRGENPRTHITREDDQYNPAGYVVPGQPVVIDGNP